MDNVAGENGAAYKNRFRRGGAERAQEAATGLAASAWKEKEVGRQTPRMKWREKKESEGKRCVVKNLCRQRSDPTRVGNGLGSSLAGEHSLPAANRMEIWVCLSSRSPYPDPNALANRDGPDSGVHGPAGGALCPVGRRAGEVGF